LLLGGVVAEGVAEGAAVLGAATLIATPLDQTNLLPFFMQV
jgi:hypothetical protein